MIVISVPVPVAANTATVVAPTAAFQMLFAPIGASFLSGSEGMPGSSGFAYSSTANSNVGDDTLIGGDGSDLHIGAVGSEILIGGFGSELQSENASSEVLIDGYFTLDAEPIAVDGSPTNA